MFDEVTRQEYGRRAARRGAFFLISTTLQALLVAAVIARSARLAAHAAEGPAVDVKFIKQPLAPPPPPQPPAARRTLLKPRTDTEAAPTEPAILLAMIQPREVPAELKPPDPNEAIEEELGDEGVDGGVVGGVVAAAASSGGIEEAPQYATAGFRTPALQTPHCIERSIRIPRDLQGIISFATVRLAVGRDGKVSLFQVMTPVPDTRIALAIWQAVQSCPFTPGVDPQGRPVKIWVIVPIRFPGG